MYLGNFQNLEDFFGCFLDLFFEMLWNSFGILLEFLSEIDRIFEYKRNSCFCQDFGLIEKERREEGRRFFNP